jgi:phosphate transport system substrate-binding protein
MIILNRSHVLNILKIFMIISGRFFAYSLIKPDVAFSYTGTGSGAGRRAVRNGLVDFAGSDAPLTASDLQLVSY